MKNYSPITQRLMNQARNNAGASGVGFGGEPPANRPVAKPAPQPSVRKIAVDNGTVQKMNQPASNSPQSYHDQAQRFIKGAKALGMTVQAENGELIAYPKGMKPRQQ